MKNHFSTYILLLILYTLTGRKSTDFSNNIKNYIHTVFIPSKIVKTDYGYKIPFNVFVYNISKKTICINLL